MVLNKKYKMFATGYIKTCNGPALVQSRYSMLWKSLKNVGKGGIRIHRTLVRSTIFKTGDKSLYYYLKLYLNVFI